MKKVLLAVALLSMNLVSLGEERDIREKKLTYQIGDKVDNFEIKSLEGKKVQLNEFIGKKVLINFTTTWCPDCQREKAIMEPDYQERFKDNPNVEFMVIHGPFKSDNFEIVQKYVEDNKFTFPSYYDSDKAVLRQFNVVNIPTNFLIDENGIVEDINIEDGYQDMKFFKKDELK